MNGKSRGPEVGSIRKYGPRPLTDHRGTNTRLVPISSVKLEAGRDVDLKSKSQSACNRPVAMTYDPCR